MMQYQTIISANKFQSIGCYLVQQMHEKFFRGLPAEQVSKRKYSFTLALIFGLLLLIGIGGNYVAGQPKIDQQVLSIFLLGILYIYILCIAIEFGIDNLIKTSRDHLMAALITEGDREDLIHAFEYYFSVKKQFLFGVIFSLLAHIAFIVLDPSLIFKFGWGVLFVNVIFHTFHGFCVYFFIAYLSWGLQSLKNYRFDLFELDPSSTEIIQKLANLLQSTVSLTTLMVASATIIFSSARILPFASVAGMILLMWISTITLYFINRHILKTIILRAKWEKLKKIQEQIRSLENIDSIPAKETLEHIKLLKEYHDKIKGTPDSPWDFTRYFTMMNTLIWPTLGIIASNVTDFVNLIETISKIKLP
jgi:ABC-type multidrug transport system fused ATPase/permease subunit